jgi:hypothetical protein
MRCNPDDIKSLVTRLTTQILRPGQLLLLVKRKTNKRLDDKKSPVEFSLRNEPKEMLKKQ